MEIFFKKAIEGETANCDKASLWPNFSESPLNSLSNQSLTSGLIPVFVSPSFSKNPAKLV